MRSSHDLGSKRVANSMRGGCPGAASVRLAAGVLVLGRACAHRLLLRFLDGVEEQVLVLEPDADAVRVLEFAAQDRLRQRVLQQALDGPPERPRAEVRIV